LKSIASSPFNDMGRAIAGVDRLPNGNLIISGFGSAGAVWPSITTGTRLPRAGAISACG